MEGRGSPRAVQQEQQQKNETRENHKKTLLGGSAEKRKKTRSISHRFLAFPTVSGSCFMLYLVAAGKSYLLCQIQALTPNAKETMRGDWKEEAGLSGIVFAPPTFFLSQPPLGLNKK